MERELFFLRAVRDCEAIAVFVLHRFTIHEQHVVMGLVRGNVVEGDVPGIERAIARQRDLLPMSEGADDFNRCGRLGLPVGQPPAEHFGKALRAFLGIVL